MHVLMEETTLNGDPGAGAAPAASPDAGAAPAAKSEAAPAEPKQLTETQVVSGMDDAIARGLGYRKEEETPEQKAAKEAEAAKAREAELAKMSEAERTAAAAADKAKAEETAKAKAAEAAKPKTISPISDEEKKTWSQRSQQRFQEAFGEIRRLTAEREQLLSSNKELVAARDSILSVLEETHTTDDQLAQLLEFNRMVQTGNYENALKQVEAQRAGLLKLLGREAPGVDLLADFPDLVKEVEDEKLDRALALEIAQNRRNAAVLKAREQQRGGEQEAARKQQELSEQALQSIKDWSNEMAKSDIDFKAKEDKLLTQVAQVVKDYPPGQWLQTLKMLYGNISVARAAVPGGEQPLRPKTERHGGAAPQDMLQAINQGLGYNKP